MKRLFLLPSIFAFLVFPGCIKDESCKDKTIQSEDAAMLAYASANSITVTRHASGMYYQVIQAGTGPIASSSSLISVKYTGKLLDGTIFDQQVNPTQPYQLSGFIPGWQLGIPLIQEGGILKLIVPSALAYGCKGGGPIPGNAILYFEIELVDVQ
jgi:FKBP-type peptidyl-prolyl cis-trans isomerase FkpA